MVPIPYSAQIFGVKDLLAKIKLHLESVCTFYKEHRGHLVQCRNDINFDTRPHNIVFWHVKLQ